jgi:hypothetical protein
MLAIMVNTLVAGLTGIGVVAVQSIGHEGACPYSIHLFIDVLSKVGHVKNAAFILQVRINQVSPEAFKHG